MELSGNQNKILRCTKGEGLLFCAGGGGGCEKKFLIFYLESIYVGDVCDFAQITPLFPSHHPSKDPEFMFV